MVMGESLIREVHGVPAWLLKEYLIELGGEFGGENLVSGDGWIATFIRIGYFKIGSISVGRLRLQIDGDSEALQNLVPQLEMKLLRGGG